MSNTGVPTVGSIRGIETALLVPSRLMVTDRFAEPLMGSSLVAWADRAAAPPIASGVNRDPGIELCSKPMAANPIAQPSLMQQSRKLRGGSKGRGSAPGPRQGALPPGPPTKGGGL